jgi:cytochrome d ubiquinol oxidase subunit I
MGFLSDVVALSRFQFALTIIFHFLFVPLSIGLGLIVALAETRYYKSRDPQDKAASNFWIKIFTATFVVGVATGITMEFAFGTNWADYSRFVGDIFGAPLAAEALFAFFLESSFLGVLLFGRAKVSPKFYMVSSWLVWCGSALSALWIIIANSWMQTPAGYKVVQTSAGPKAEITNFFAAALNPSTLPRYTHTVTALLIFGAFISMAVGAYYLLKGRHVSFARKTIKTGATVALITMIIMLPTAHWQASEMAANQPEKLAAIEGQWETGPSAMSLIGWVDTAGHKTIALSIPKLTSFVASGNFNTPYIGLNDIAPTDRAPIQVTFQAYHLMVALFAVIVIIAAGAWWLSRKDKTFFGTKEEGAKRWPLYTLLWAPLAPFLAINAGWMVAEIGRQPWIVWGELRTVDGISKAVPADQILITIALFIVVYTVLFIAWLRVVGGFIKKGPEIEGGSASQPAPLTTPAEVN